MPDEMPDVPNILAALEVAGVRFVLIGGLAMVAHGSAHITQDLDLCYARDTANVTALAAALAPYAPRLRGAPEGLPFVLDARAFRNVLNFTLQTSLGAIDLLGEVAGAASFEGIWQRALVLELFGVSVRVVALADLIAMKRAAGRPKDKAHLAELLALQRLLQDTDTSQV